MGMFRLRKLGAKKLGAKKLGAKKLGAKKKAHEGPWACDRTSA